MSVGVTFGISEDDQVSEFMNATLQSFGGDLAISVAVYLEHPVDLDLHDENAVRIWLNSVFSSAVEQGCTVEVQVGPAEED